MKLLKIIAVSATLFAGATAAYASPFDSMGGVMALDAISQAQYASVESVTAGDVPFLRSMTDIDALRQRIASNPYLAKTVVDQGYTIGDIVGIDGTGTGTSVTLYVL